MGTTMMVHVVRRPIRFLRSRPGANLARGVPDEEEEGASINEELPELPLEDGGEGEDSRMKDRGECASSRSLDGELLSGAVLHGEGEGGGVNMGSWGRS